MKKFPKIKYPNDPETDGVLAGPVVVTEKLDGANFRWTWPEDDELHIGTRNHTYPASDENVPKAFHHAVNYIEEQTPNALTEIDGIPLEDITFFGEAMHKHSLVYDDVEYVQPHSGSPYFGGDWPNVVMFDAMIDGEWADWEQVEHFSHKMGFCLARVLDRGDPTDGDEIDLEVPDESMFGGMPEGIVVRRTDGSVRAKKVTDDFKEVHNQEMGGERPMSDADRFRRDYVTDARIEKCAHKLVDEGRYDGLKMDMMEDLPRRVIKDAMEENAWAVMNEDYGQEFNDWAGEVRSVVSKKCARVLKTLVQEF